MLIEDQIQNKFEEVAKSRGFRIVINLRVESPDVIMEKDGKLIGVEIKSNCRASSLFMALGQLLFGKNIFELDELWLVLPFIENSFNKEWFQVFNSNVIKVFILFNGNLIEVNDRLLVNEPRLESLKELCRYQKITVYTINSSGM